MLQLSIHSFLLIFKMSSFWQWINKYAHKGSDRDKQMIMLYNRAEKLCSLLPNDILVPLSIRSVVSNDCGKLVPDSYHYFVRCLYKQQQQQWLPLPIYHTLLYILCGRMVIEKKCHKNGHPLSKLMTKVMYQWFFITITFFSCEMMLMKLDQCFTDITFNG